MARIGQMVALAALALAGATVAAAQPAGDAVRGKTVYARCAACHDLNTGVTRLGPSLKGVVGAKAAQKRGFAYSAALKGRDLTWDAATLDTFLTSPSRAVPGNRMAFAGLPNPQDRADLIAYLTQAAR